MKRPRIVSPAPKPNLPIPFHRRVPRWLSDSARGLLAGLVLGAATMQAATFTVANTNDAGEGSLRDAVLQANTDPDADTIVFEPALTTGTFAVITLSTDEFFIDSDLTITGPGANFLTVNGNGASRIFRVNGGRTVTISGMTLTGGVCPSFEFSGGGGAIRNQGTLTISASIITENSTAEFGMEILGGGAILNQGTLTINDSTLSGNFTGINSQGGGAIYNEFGATVAISASTLSGNFTGPECQSGGGAIFSQGAVTITDSTFSGNYTSEGSNDSGAVISTYSGADIRIINSTISGNTDNSSGNRSSAILNLYGNLSITQSTITGNVPAGISSESGNPSANLSISNSIVAGNGSADLRQSGSLVFFTSNGANFIGAVDASVTLAQTDKTFASTNTTLGQVINVTLADNGGPTLTHALALNSPAINAGNDADAVNADSEPLTNDQRGATFARKFGVVDLGAIEASFAPEIVIELPAGTPLPTRTISAWGDNSQGQINVPAGLDAVQSVVGGFIHTLALKGDGSVVSWGSNNNNQSIVPAEALSGVQAIAAGAYHSVALTTAGGVLAWGANAHGEATVPVEALFGVQAIAAGNSHTIALTNDGGVLAWGDNGAGLTTVPAEAQSGVVAIAAGGLHDVALKDDSGVIAWGFDGNGQRTVPIEAQFGVIAIAAGGLHTVALKEDGSVIAWGDNSYGQTTVPAEAQSGVQAIAAGFYHTVALKTDGTVLAWGSNSNGQLSVPGLTAVQAIGAGYYGTLALANSAVPFGDENVGFTSEAKTFTIRNTGNATLHISSLSLIGDSADSFAVDAVESSDTLEEGVGETTFTVTFTPTSPGVKTATLRVSSDDADEGDYDILLTGNGVLVPAINGFTTGVKTIDIDVLARVEGVNRNTAVFTFPTPPEHGTVRIVGGKIRYIPTGPLPLGGDSFTYHYDDGQGGSAAGTVTITNFAAIAGEYDGLITAELPRISVLGLDLDGAARHRQSGHLRMSLSRTGAFTATLTFAGTPLNQIGQTNAGAYAFMGVLDSTGKIVRSIQRRGLPPIAFSLQCDGENGTITGTAASTDGAAPFTSDTTLAKRTAPGDSAGNYTLQIEPDGTPNVPTGNGILIAKVAASGNVIIAGRLADGKAFSTVGFFHADETFPIYAVVYDGTAATRGSLRGVIELPGIGRRAIFGNNTLEWFKPARPRDVLFPTGFTMYPTASFLLQ